MTDSKGAEETAMDAIVDMSGGGQRATCPGCGDTGLHPFGESPADLECRSCGARFEGGKS